MHALSGPCGCAKCGFAILWFVRIRFVLQDRQGVDVWHTVLRNAVLAFEENPFGDAPRKQALEIGGDLSTLSVEDLDAHIVELQSEIVRLQSERKRKVKSVDAANAFFKT